MSVFPTSKPATHEFEQRTEQVCLFEEVLSINPDQCLSSGTHCSHVTCPPVLSPLQDWVPTVDPCQTQRAEKCWCNQHQPTHAVHTGSNAQRIQCSLGVQAFRSLGTRTSADPLCPPPPPTPPPRAPRPPPPPPAAPPPPGGAGCVGGGAGGPGKEGWCCFGGR